MRSQLVSRGRRALLIGLFACLTVWGQRLDRGRAARLLQRPHAEGQFIVKFREAAPEAEDLGRYSAGGVRGMERVGDVHLVRTNGRGAAVLQALSEHPDVEYVEPDYVITAGKTPNDALFGQQWGLKNTVMVGADIAAAAAWDYTTGGRKAVVAVIDTGVDYTHPDLAANVWAAPRAFTFTGASGPVTCPAGTRGVNAITSTCNPMDDNGHGTHCAGIVGASGNNTSGVSGVNWTASILPLKFLGNKGSGVLSDALRAIDTAVQIKKQFGAEGNVRVISASWGFVGNSQALDAAIAAVNAADILFVAAAGNSAQDNDLNANFPANTAQPNVITVAATDKFDGLATFSNYGTKVHLGAPGVGIQSTYLNGQYVSMNGTSMATPFVAGAAALLLSNCTATTAELKGHLLASVDMIPTLAGKTSTGGRLNLYTAIRRCAMPSVTITATPAVRVVKAGETAVYSLLPAAMGGLSGAGTITVTGAPAGVTWTLGGPVTLGTAVNASVVVAKTVPVGTYALLANLVVGTGYKASVPLTLTVQAAPQFGFTVTGPTAAVTPGGKASLTIALTRQAGFTGAVTVTAAGLPAGVTAAPVTFASGQTSANMTVNVATAAVAGAVAMQLTGTGGTPVRSLMLPATVTVARAMTLTFGTGQYTVKGGTTAKMTLTLAANGPMPASLRFSISGLPGPSAVSIFSGVGGAFQLMIPTQAAWAGKTATVKLTAADGTLVAEGTTKLTVTK
jgi:subtilisin family serine protease